MKKISEKAATRLARAGCAITYIVVTSLGMVYGVVCGVYAANAVFDKIESLGATPEMIED